MTTHAEIRRVHDTRSATVVTALVDRGLVDADRRGEALLTVEAVLGGTVAAPAPLRRRFAELAGYLGGSLVVAAAGIFLTSRWGGLTSGERVGLLGGATAVLVVAGLALVLTGKQTVASRDGRGAVRRRLTGLLFTAGAATAAATVGLQAGETLASTNSTEALLASFTLLLVAAIGYLLAPTVVGQLGIAVGAFLTVPWALDEIGDIEPVAFGLLMLLAGAGWLVMAERGVWAEVASARVIGSVLALAGAQIPAFDDELRWVAYVALAAVAAAVLALFVVRPAWPYLAAGVVAVTVVVPEAVLDWTDGSLGAAGGLLVAGGTLLAASLLGLRLRQEVLEDPGATANRPLSM